MNRACQLIEELGAGEVVGGCVDVYPEKKEPIDVAYDVDKINALLGIDVSEDEMCKYWEMVELVPDKAKKCVHVPAWRQDILRLADLAEEVARFYGYDKIPTTLPSGEATQGGVSYQTSICNMIRNINKFIAQKAQKEVTDDNMDKGRIEIQRKSDCKDVLLEAGAGFIDFIGNYRRSDKCRQKWCEKFSECVNRKRGCIGSVERH